MHKRYLGPLYLSLAASIWGGMFVSSKYLLDTIPPFTLLFSRYLVATFILFMVSRFQKGRFKPIKHWGWFMQIGIIGYFLSIGTQFIGTKLSNAHLASLITTLSPIFLSVFAIFLLHERMTKIQVLSLILAVCGVFTIVGFPSEGESQSFIGTIILLFTSMSWGYYSVIARKASEVYSPLQITTIGMFIATIITFPVTFIELKQWQFAQVWDWTIIWNFLFIAVIATAFAFFSWNKGLELTPSHQAGVFFFLQPIFGSLLGWLLLKEYLSLSFLIGSIIILIGVYFSMRSEART